MTIQLTQARVVSGSVAASGSQHTLDEATEAYFVEMGWATYVGAEPYQGGSTVPASLATDSSGNVTGLVGPEGVIPIDPPTYTWATKPDPATADVDVTIRITDVGATAWGSLWYTDGTRWRPVGDRLVLGNVAFAGTTNGTNTETIGYELALPAGLLQTGDEISVSPYVFKSGGTSDSGTVLCRIGATQGTLGSTLWLTMAQPATTNLRAHARWAWGKASATVLHYLSVGGASAAGGTTTNAQNDVTVPNLDTQTTYFQVTTKLTTGGTETLTLKSCPVVLECR